MNSFTIRPARRGAGSPVLVAILAGFVVGLYLLANMTVLRTQPSPSTKAIAATMEDTQHIIEPEPQPIIVLQQDDPDLQPQQPNQQLTWSLTPCSNHLLRDFDQNKLKHAIIHRLQWTGSTTPYRILQAELNKNMRSQPVIAPDDMFADKSVTPWRAFAVGGSWSFYGNTHKRFDLMGPVYDDLCPRVEIFGKSDEEKRFCVDKEGKMLQPGCTVFSIGSNNIWEFETDIAKRTPCQIYTFDCTIGKPIIPPEINDRVKFFPLCLAAKTTGRYRNYWDLLKEVGLTKSGPTLLKMDVEGYEWDFFESMMESAERAMEETGEDLYPMQIAVEVHFLALIGQSWYGRDMSPAEFLAMFNALFLKAGYVIAQQRHNLHCNACSEILLLKAGCFSSLKG